MYAAEEYYTGLEQDLQDKINRIESDYPGYDEYKYSMAQVGHNPYELISYLTAVYMDFTFNSIKGNLDELFNSQYHLRITETTEQRVDGDGNAYDYKILNVTLTNDGFTQALTADQRELYYIYLESKGNRDYLFADDIYANESDGPVYTIPGEALTDETFRRLITEAEKYLGFPYVWGGSTPATSFDCSGFVCWVFSNSGVYPLSRTTAQGIYNQCARVSPQEAKPGDLIFFKGTYATNEISHIGIYVGDGMMIHAGNPIQYTSVNTNYWQSHFYAYGRLGGN
ncbi:MAG: C40 family peptidase [Monoglobales bacterium]